MKNKKQDDRVITPPAIYIEEVKERIKKDEFDNLFTTNHIIDDCSFVDFLFIGNYKGKEVVWNATITTARSDYFEKIDNKALDESYKIYPDPEGFDWSKSFIPLNDGTGNFEMINQHPKLSFQRREYHCKLLIDMFNSKKLKLNPWKVSIDESYNYGIGLHVRMNINSINLKDIQEFIEQFQKYGTDAFLDDTYDKTRICLNAKEMGVEYKEGSQFINWTQPNPCTSVALKVK